MERSNVHSTLAGPTKLPYSIKQQAFSDLNTD
jgi:hypothetical protein